MSQVKFQKLIDEFSPDSLAEVFKGHDFFRIKDSKLSSFNNKQFIDFTQLGGFDLEDNTNIVVICARSLTPLNERASRKTQYDLGKKILKNFQNARAGIFVYYDNKGDFRMSLIYADYVGTKVNYSTFRRFTYFISKQQKNVTFLQQVAPLNFTNFKEIKELFSVEKVTKEFFRKYRDLFIEILEDFEENNEFQNIVVKTGISTTADFVKKLMGQTVFLYFVQKKGWLGVRPNENWGTGDQGYLRSLFETCKKSNENYFNDYLEPLFYEALAEKRGEDDFFEKLNCRVPFLNGGLFESVYDWKNTEINIHNEVLDKLLDFFDQYNFTVDENTPSDQEISVDPEMLGKIFENLLEVKDRKDKGAFYTPREIVHYMCRESLIQHLVSEKTAPEERIRKLFEIKDTGLSLVVGNEEKAKNIKEVKEISEKIDLSLRNVKIVDPAVGSGAFPMGMLNEISSVRYYLNTNFLHKTNNSGKELSLYDIKKETLENCIYAVDLEPGAVEIAKLRFWLALIVEFESNDPKIAPPVLPNLDYKIMQGNSLLEEYEGIKLFDEKLLKQPLINAEIFTQENQVISKLQSELMSFYMKNPEWMQKGEHKNKPVEVSNLESKIRDLLKQKKKIDQDSVDQKDLFTSSTGDSKLIWDEIKSKHKRFFSESDREKKKDLRKQIDHLNWLLIESTLEEQKNDSALEKLKELKKSNTKPFFLWHLYFADVFEEKGGFDIVIGNPPYGFRDVLTKQEKEYFRKVENIEFSSGDSAELFCKKSFDKLVRKNGILSFIVPKKSLYGDAWDGFRKNYWLNNNLKFLLDSSKAFDEVLLEASAFGLVKNTITSKVRCSYLNKDNTVVEFGCADKEEIFLENNTAQIYKITIPHIFWNKIQSSKTSEALVVGKLGLAIGTDFFSETETEYKLLKGIDINRWKVKSNRWLKNKQKLKWESAKEFLKPKIITQRLVAHIENPFPHIKITSCYDKEGVLITNTLMSFELSEKISPEFWLAYLNSSFASWYAYNFIYTRAIRSMDFYNFYIQQIPISKSILIKDSQEPFIKLVNSILNITKTNDYLRNAEKQADVKKLEHQIDGLVYKLYNLTQEEIEIVENSSKN